MKEGSEFLKKKYELHKAPEVESAVRRQEKRTKERVSQKPAERIQVYLGRFKEIIERKDPEKRERGMRALKKILHDQYVIKPEDIPESYFELQKKIAREQGHGDIEITKELREQAADVIITDQTTTLDNWIDYLASPDATYPDWLKYWTMRSVLSMGDYDKEKKFFTKRSKDTVKPFPDINREALAYVLDAISQKYGKQHIELLALNEEEKKEFEQLLQGENFGKLYAWALEKTAVPPQEGLENIKGKWVKYPQNSDHLPLVESLQGHGTGWCTAGESTAKIQLQGGDFYVYYSYDKNNKPTIPRVAIRMQGSEIGEVRGIGSNQNMDPYIGDVLKAKMKEFPDGEKYEKKSADMKLLTQIDNKIRKNGQLTKDELVFLYEINSKIEGFGYQRDPRIEEIRKQRNPEEDMLIVFECTKDQIARNPQEINKNTKAYVGSLQKDIFTKIQEHSIEHVYTSFPEGKIQKYNIEIGGKTKTQLEKDLKAKNIYISSWADDLLNSKDFTTLKKAGKENLIRLTVKDLGFPEGATTDQIYKRAHEVGLELCPAEIGPNLRLQYSGTEWFLIGMKQISDRDGYPSVFSLDWSGGRLKLSASYAKPSDGWDANREFIFRLRELKKES